MVKANAARILSLDVQAKLWRVTSEIVGMYGAEAALEMVRSLEEELARVAELMATKADAIGAQDGPTSL